VVYKKPYLTYATYLIRNTRRTSMHSFDRCIAQTRRRRRRNIEEIDDLCAREQRLRQPSAGFVSTFHASLGVTVVGRGGGERAVWWMR